VCVLLSAAFIHLRLPALIAVFHTFRPTTTRQSKEASVLWSHHEETRELPGERDNARNNAGCTQARKTTHGLDGQHQDVDRTLRGRVSQNDQTKVHLELHKLE